MHIGHCNTRAHLKTNSYKRARFTPSAERAGFADSLRLTPELPRAQDPSGETYLTKKFSIDLVFKIQDACSRRLAESTCQALRSAHSQYSSDSDSQHPTLSCLQSLHAGGITACLSLLVTPCDITKYLLESVKGGCGISKPE